MINISILENRKLDLISEVEVSGHANYSYHGNDIVCAAVSTLVFTLIASMSEVIGLDEKKYEYIIDSENDLIRLKFFTEILSKEEIRSIDLLTKMFKTGIINSIEDYKEYATVTIEEV
ncbi:MAG: ribosomal-processing cysteine protease Prp [Tissierellia bacterium]|nr:ribosomal-processing cysteine protease Prp [Tissierellia bacterium]